MKAILVRAFIISAICSLSIVQASEAWWLRAEFAPKNSEIESIPVKELDPTWVAASPLREADLPPEASVSGESIKEHGGAFEITADIYGDKQPEKILVGVYRDKFGVVGRFVLVLDGSKQGGWKKRALFTEPGKAEFSVLFLNGRNLVWASCMECDSSCLIVPSPAVWKLKCGSCCEESAGGDEYRVKVMSESPGKSSRIYGDIKLMTAQDQELFIYNGIRKKKRLYTKLPFRYEPQIKWYGDELVEVTVGTGSPGRFSIFYDLKKDRLSKQMWFVLAFDRKRQIALLGEDRLRLVRVFDNKEILEIKRNDFQVTAIKFLIVEEAKFDEQGNLHIEYLNDTGGKSTAVIDSTEATRK